MKTLFASPGNTTRPTSCNALHVKTILKTIAFVTTCLFVTGVFGQSIIGKSFITQVAGVYQQCDFDGNNSNLRVFVDDKSKFTIQREIGDNYIIRFWDWKIYDSISLPSQFTTVENAYYNKTGATKGQSQILSPSTNAEKYVLINRMSNQQHAYYKVKKNELSILASELEPRFEPIYGLTTIPFKFRFKGGLDVTKDVSIGGAVGVKWRPTRSSNISLNALVGLGFSSVTLDSTNTQGTLKKGADYSAVTLYTGVVVDWNRVQLGIFVGGDFLQKRDINNWIYNRKLWFGVGLGFNIFEHKVSTKETKNN